jgi:hypothetical protein
MTTMTDATERTYRRMIALGGGYSALVARVRKRLELQDRWGDLDALAAEYVETWRREGIEQGIDLLSFLRQIDRRNGSNA